MKWTGPRSLTIQTLLVLSSVGGLAQTAPAKAGWSVVESRTLASGVVYRHLLQTTSAGEPWSIHVLETSRKERGIRIRVVPGTNPAPPTEMARELPTQMAVRENILGHHVVAVVNGDYDAMPYLGVSVGPSVTSGRLWTAGGTSTWPAIAISHRGTAVIGIPQFSAELHAGTRTIPIRTYNKSLALTDGVALYSREFRSSLSPGRQVRVVKLGMISPSLPIRLGSTITAVVAENGLRGSEVSIAPDTLVVVAVDPGSAEAAQLARLQSGQKVTLNFHLRIGSERDPEQAVGGFPVIVRSGRPVIEGKVAESHRVRHPRTAVCYNATSFIFAVVDGRQPKLSVGMTLEELGDLMVSLGCKEAINTDGGGSSVMATAESSGGVRLHIVNSPSDGKERGRGNAWVIEMDSSSTMQ